MSIFDQCLLEKKLIRSMAHFCQNPSCLREDLESKVATACRHVFHVGCIDSQKLCLVCHEECRITWKCSYERGIWRVQKIEPPSKKEEISIEEAFLENLTEQGLNQETLRAFVPRSHNFEVWKDFVLRTHEFAVKKGVKESFYKNIYKLMQVVGEPLRSEASFGDLVQAHAHSDTMIFVWQYAGENLKKDPVFYGRLVEGCGNCKNLFKLMEKAPKEFTENQDIVDTILRCAGSIEIMQGSPELWKNSLVFCKQALWRAKRGEVGALLKVVPSGIAQHPEFVQTLKDKVQ